MRAQGRATTGNVWWGDYEIPQPQVHRWRIGPLTMWIQRLLDEWRLARHEGDDPLDDALSSDRLDPAVDLYELDAAVQRFGMSGGTDQLQLAPLLADRHVVARPETPFTVPPRQRATLFVSTPLWVQLRAGDELELLQFPIYRPSDTWFGSNTREGELCYAARVGFVVRAEDSPVVPHRATTTVHVVNRGSTPLSLDRINIPVPHLALYQSAVGRIWTEDITLERTREAEFARLAVREKPPSHADRATRLAAARTRPSSNAMVRAFSSLFQGGS